MPPGEARGGMSYQQNDLVVDARMLLHQARTFFLQLPARETRRDEADYALGGAADALAAPDPDDSPSDR